jgi:3-hydroxyisobutyrate dehydrogenase-like beta-hydroxyacid dehydrogenase
MTNPRVKNIGLLHPGEMGAAVGQCLTEAGYQVLWASEGRGPDTAARARQAGMTDVRTARRMTAEAEVIMSVCPPHAAVDVAWSVHGFGGLYLDANAVAPGTAREIAEMITSSGGRYVDGGIIGSPPHQPGTTRLYLSGPDAEEVRDLFAGTAVDARVIGGPTTAASAVKMAYASWTKGSAALLLAARALAQAEGVSDVLLAEWALSQPQLAGRVDGAATAAVTKGWRWVGEMEEIAQTMAAAGLPDGFHQAAAEIYRRSPHLPGSPGKAEAAHAVLTALAGAQQSAS